MELIKAATDDSSTKDVKEKMKQIANIFQMTRQIGEAEAVYRLIPSMTMSMSNIKCVFVATGPKEERSVRWKKATDDQLNQVNGVRIADRDGLWFQQPDLWSKYLRRPTEIKDITFSQFARMYKGKAKKAEEELRSSLQRNPSPAEIAEKMGIKLNEYREWEKAFNANIHQSLDEVYDEYSMWFVSKENTPEENLDRTQLKTILTKGLKGLPEKEAMVFQLYYVEELNVYEIAEVMEITPGRVSQIKKSAISLLRHHIKKIY